MDFFPGKRLEKELKTPTVLLACPGAGAVRRGFETFIMECFETLSRRGDEISLYLARGGGIRSTGKELKILCLSRSGFSARLIGSIFRRHPYFIEQVTFAICLIPALLKLKPDVVYLSDGTLANALWRIRNVFQLSYKILFSNGGPSHPPYPRCDHIQQLTEVAYKEGESCGTPQTLLPYGFSSPPDAKPLSESERRDLRRSLKLPLEGQIVVSVAAIDKRHKRIDYLIKEISKLPPPRPHLLLLGDATDETESVLELAANLLPDEGFTAKSVDASEVGANLKASSVFVLPSLSEGFGRALVEAGLSPLPCVVHDSTNMKFILGNHGHYINMEKEGELSRKLEEILRSERRDLTSQFLELRRRFSWESLRGDYVKMILTLTQTDRV